MIETIIASAAVVIALGGLAFQHFGVLGGIKERLASLETKMELFWGAMQAKTVEMLKSSTNLRKDELLDKIHNSGYSNDEVHELKEILQAEMTDKVLDGGTALAYCLMIGRLDQISFEFKRKKKI